MFEEKDFQQKAVAAKAAKEGYAPLVAEELDYVLKAIRYNIAAQDKISMDYGVALEAGEVLDILKTMVSDERLNEIEHLITWYTDGGERCKKCDGMGYIDDVDLEHGYDCPVCEGLGYVNDVEIDED